MSQEAGKSGIPKFCFFSLRQTEEGEGDVHECYSILSGRPLTLHEQPYLATCGSWGVPLYPADFGLGIEPETSRLMAQRSPTRPCGR